MMLKELHCYRCKLNTMLLRLTAILTITTILNTIIPTSTAASILGSSILSEYSYEINHGTHLKEIVYHSDQQGVGRQSEHFIEYSPNSGITPIVTNGQYIYGRKNINQEYSHLQTEGINTAAGINGDFYSLETGVPIGHFIMNDGTIMSKSDFSMPAIGFNADGTAFIDNLQIRCNMSIDNQYVGTVENINKYRQPNFYYLFTDKFAPTIKASTNGVSVILRVISGEMKIGQTITTEVTEVYNIGEDDVEKDVQIPKEHLVLSMDAASLALDRLSFLQELEKGTEIKFDFKTDNDTLWSNAQSALSTNGGRLLQNGQIPPGLTASAAPRTAIGIKANGDIVFYTIDGRQLGYSYGARLETAAARLLELGCVDAINLDGGGSTTLGAHYPGNSDFSIINRPSDGSLRGNGTYVFLKINNTPTGGIDRLFLYPNVFYALTGSTIGFDDVRATDINYFPTAFNQFVTLKTEDGLQINADNTITINADGIYDITAEYGHAQGFAKLTAISSPDRVVLKYKDKDVSSMALSYGDIIELTAEAIYQNKAVASQNNNYTWYVDPEIGNITDGVLYITTDKALSGKVTATAGEAFAEIDISVNSDFFVDIRDNWAREYIVEMYNEGILKGFAEEDGRNYFYPQKPMTRAEISAVICRLLNLDVSAYSNVELFFEDEIPDWAQDYAKALFSENIMLGVVEDDGKTYFHSSQNLTRAQAFTIINRIVAKDNMPTPLPFADAEEIPPWAIEHFESLINLGIIGGYEDNTIKPLNEITRAEITKVICYLDLFPDSEGQESDTVTTPPVTLNTLPEPIPIP